MFSRFRRAAQESEAEPTPLLLPVLDSEALVVDVRPFGGDPVQVDLTSLSVAGAVVQADVGRGPMLNVDDMAEVAVAAASGEWQIATAALVTGREAEGAIVTYTFGFVNDGNLFEQIGDAAGRWFNRRRHPRARPELDSRPTVELSFRHFRWKGHLFDVSVSGFCATLDDLASSTLRVDEEISFSFELPGVKKPFEGTGRVCNVRRMRRKAFVGIEHDLGSDKRGRELTRYIERRLEAMAAFARSMRE